MWRSVLLLKTVPWTRDAGTFCNERPRTDGQRGGKMESGGEAESDEL